jgi:hypothetical protein
MAPAHSNHPRVQHQHQHQQRDQSANSDIVEHGLFLEPMMGTPLAMYVHKDVSDHDRVVDLITVSPCAGCRYHCSTSAQFSISKTRLCRYLYKIWNSSEWLPEVFLWMIAFDHRPMFLTRLLHRKMEALSPTLTVESVIS